MYFPAAPWPALLKVMTAAGTVVLLALMLGLSNHESTRLMAGLPLAVWGLCAWYMVRGFRIDGDTLVIQRLSTETRIPLHQPLRVENRPPPCWMPAAPLATAESLPSPGLTAIAGLGPFRLYATDPLKAVILHLPDQVVVVTPADPQAFMAALPGHHGAAS
jgi:hypothetical protein